MEGGSEDECDLLRGWLRTGNTCGIWRTHLSLDAVLEPPGPGQAKYVDPIFRAGRPDIYDLTRPRRPEHRIR